MLKYIESDRLLGLVFNYILFAPFLVKNQANNNKIFKQNEIKILLYFFFSENVIIANLFKNEECK